jgi:hypothetical protein
VTDVEHVYLLLFLQDAKYRPVDMRLAPIQQMPRLFLPGRRRVSVRLFFQTENGLLETSVPFQGRVGIFGI